MILLVCHKPDVWPGFSALMALETGPYLKKMMKTKAFRFECTIWPNQTAEVPIYAKTKAEALVICTDQYGANGPITYKPCRKKSQRIGDPINSLLNLKFPSAK